MCRYEDMKETYTTIVSEVAPNNSTLYPTINQVCNNAWQIHFDNEFSLAFDFIIITLAMIMIILWLNGKLRQSSFSLMLIGMVIARCVADACNRITMWYSGTIQ